MIGRLRGTLETRAPGEVLVDVGGVGYEAAISLQTFASLPAAGAPVELEVVTVLRENALELFAFADAKEKAAFLLLRTVSGVGPRMALAVLSGIRVDDLADAVESGDTGRLTAIPGIGRKTAERIRIDLRGKLQAGPAAPTGTAGRLHEDAVSALLGLGYKPAQAEKAVRAVADGKDGVLELEEVIRAALAGLVRDASR